MNLYLIKGPNVFDVPNFMVEATDSDSAVWAADRLCPWNRKHIGYECTLSVKTMRREKGLASIAFVPIGKFKLESK